MVDSELYCLSFLNYFVKHWDPFWWKMLDTANIELLWWTIWPWIHFLVPSLADFQDIHNLQLFANYGSGKSNWGLKLWISVSLFIMKIIGMSVCQCLQVQWHSSAAISHPWATPAANPSCLGTHAAHTGDTTWVPDYGGKEKLYYCVLWVGNIWRGSW